MPVNVEQKVLPRNREFRFSWDDVLLGSTMVGLCSGIWATWNLSDDTSVVIMQLSLLLLKSLSLYRCEENGQQWRCTTPIYLPTDNTFTSPSFFSFTLVPSSFTRSVFGTVALVWWVSTKDPPSTALFWPSAEASKEGKKRGDGGFRGSFRESKGVMSTGGHFLWAQRVQQ